MQKKTFFQTLLDFDDNAFRRLIAISIAIVTLLTAVLAYLQSDAGARDDQANRDGMRYALETFGQQVSGDARVNFDYNVAYQAYYEYLLLSNSASNREQEDAALRYQTLADETVLLSPMLQSPYYDPAGSEEPDVARYTSDIYTVQITALLEKYLAASAVKDAWDYKANTYIIHITLLAISLFLLGLATTVSSAWTRWFLAASGLAVALVGVGWAAVTFAKPVFDLRQQGNAIQDYALGVGLSEQDLNEEAIEAFDRAIEAYPQYANAYSARAWAYYELGDYAMAASDLEAATAAGDKSASTAGDLAYMYYLVGEYQQSLQASERALQASPDELWVRFDRALTLLAAGQGDESRAEYERGMKLAADQVAQARQEGGEPPSYLWQALTDAADALDVALFSLEAGLGSPDPASFVNPDLMRTKGQEWMFELKSLAVALEYTGQAPQGSVSAQISPFSFVQPIVDEEGTVVDYSEPVEAFEYGIDEFAVLFDYAGMTDGSDVVFKLYINGEEDPSWRIVDAWSLGSEGSAEIPISYAYSDTFVFDPGEYIVELYVNYHLVQRGVFQIEE